MAEQQKVVKMDNHTLTIGVTTEFDPEEEFERSQEYVQTLVDKYGIEEMRTRYYASWWGRVLFTKEVGPPPWKYPKIKGDLNLHKPATVRLGIGWRSTLYTVTYMAKRKPKKE